MITGRFLITAGIAAAVLALTACSGGQKSAAGKETQKTEAQQEKAGTENRPAQQEENGTEARTAQQAESRTEAQASQYVKYRPEEAKEVMDSDEALIVVDVRTPEEYAESRIGDAINIPVEEIGEEMPGELPDLDAKIMVYCRSGVRSKNAAEKLLDLGYKNIIDIGGIKDWPYETVSGEKQ